MDFVTDKKAIEYLKSFPKKKRVNFSEIFPGAVPEALDFLDKCLQFNPRKRITIADAIAHPLCAKVRDTKKETVAKGCRPSIHSFRPHHPRVREGRRPADPQAPRTLPTRDRQVQEEVN